MKTPKKFWPGAEFIWGTRMPNEPEHLIMKFYGFFWRGWMIGKRVDISILDKGWNQEEKDSQ